MTGVTLLLLGALVALGLNGALGGRAHTSRAASASALLEVHGPAVIRNGEFLELTIRMTPRRNVANAALEIDAGLWRDITVNTMIPAPEKEEYRNGVMRFEFGPLAAGENAALKIDAQVNPHRFGPSRGSFAFLDGDEELASLDRGLRVIP